MNRTAYNLLFHLALPAVLGRMLWRSLKAPAYRQRLGERLGRGPELPAGGVWLHAVSVGETIAAAPLVRWLRAQHPELPLTVTNATPTGADRARALFGDQVAHSHAPWDLPWAVERFLDRTRPRLVLLMETELWPNIVHACSSRGIPVMLVNARLSARSARGYRRLGALTRELVSQLSRVAAQTEADGERFVALGLSPERLSVTGSIKFDQDIDEGVRAKAEALRQAWHEAAGRLVWIAASTHQGEDEQLLEVFRVARSRCPGLLLVLVPRHPERFGQVEQLCVDRGFATLRRTQGHPGPDTEVLVADTMGELLALYGAADLAFVGGSLVPVGGHNLLEPAAWGLPVLSGPHLFNFLEISEMLAEAGALRVVADADELASQLLPLLEDARARRHMGRAGAGVLEANRGALGRLTALVDRVLQGPPGA